MANSAVRNSEIARILKETAAFLEAEGVPFKPRAFEKAASAIEGMDLEVVDLYRKGGLAALEKIPGVGKGIAERIEEFLRTGRIKDYERLKKKYPVDLQELTSIEGLGPKGAIKLYKKLKVKNTAELERAARAGKVRVLPGFGKKSEEKILKGIDFLKKSGGRALLGNVLPSVRVIEERLKKLEGVDSVVVCGSIRRMQETVGDIDILVTSKSPRAVMDYFAAMPEVIHVYGKGDTKTMVRLDIGLDADLRVVPPESYGAAVQYFSGDKNHNISLREIAMKKGLKLNEYGLYKKGRLIAGEREEDIYRALGLNWIPPELRTDSGEIAAARVGKLPKLVGYGDLRGDLQVQTDWTDGKDSIEAMARAAAGRGLEYIAVTDHTKRLAMAHGLDEKRIIKQWAEIDRVNRKFGGRIRILKGSECDILKDGSLDLPDKILSQLDVCGASIHSHFNLGRKEQTERLKRAMANPHVDIVFHPTGRIIQKRAACELDIDEVIDFAEETGTVLEVNASPDRLDLKDEYVRKCTEKGVMMSIDSDAHAAAHFSFLEYGIAQARRGWAERSDIINAWPLEKMLKHLKN
ncbi:MAG TPA: DNA polymerase/3'-5' exonuclease PolX [Candidatus Paceibacterota bacterium]|nr:DNA polymerase/3'-5' exonuclease PolX [Candidatus Paceibacterota bacterium]